MQAPDLVVLAGRPGMGKTALGLGMALAAAGAGVRTAVFSLEMSAAQLGLRALALKTEIAAERLHRGAVAQGDFDKILNAQQALAALPLHIDDSAGLTAERIAGAAHRLKRQGLGLVIVDHLGHVRPPRPLESAARVHQITHITGAFKALAKELAVPVVVLSQLSRAVNARESKRPQLSDLRDSGSIEQDADVVLTLYRDAYYMTQEEPRADDPKHAAWVEKLARVRSLAELHLLKNRHGPTGRIDLYFDAACMGFGAADPPRGGEGVSIQAVAWVLEQRITSPGAKLTLLALANHADHANHACWPSIATLARETSLSKRAVQRQIKALAEAGWIRIERQFRDDGSQTSNRYVLAQAQAADMSPRGEELSPRDDAPVGGGGDAAVMAGVTQAPPLMEPSREPSDESSSTTAIEASFEAWWQLVPRKVGKGQARKAFTSALKRVPAAVLRAGITRYAAECAGREPGFIAHPATWLNGERWEDEPAPAGAAQAGGAGYRAGGTGGFGAGGFGGDPPPTRFREIDDELAARLKATEAAYQRRRAAG